MHFIIDAQLPPALADWLRAQGHEATHVFEIGMGSSKDIDVWKYAASRSAVLMTKDDDFITALAQAPAPPSIVWLRIGNASTKALLAWLAPRMPAVIASVMRGEKAIEVR